MRAIKSSYVDRVSPFLPTSSSSPLYTIRTKCSPVLLSLRSSMITYDANGGHFPSDTSSAPNSGMIVVSCALKSISFQVSVPSFACTNASLISRTSRPIAKVSASLSGSSSLPCNTSLTCHSPKATASSFISIVIPSGSFLPCASSATMWSRKVSGDETFSVPRTRCASSRRAVVRSLVHSLRWRSKNLPSAGQCFPLGNKVSPAFSWMWMGNGREERLVCGYIPLMTPCAVTTVRSTVVDRRKISSSVKSFPRKPVAM
mmetsp:Transcript_8636/g.21480  ORF Transcript_8636/g.21480 Transcript_8636/m.21480 type:complete len:259 (+) Transcript_8636:136-912(+)